MTLRAYQEQDSEIIASWVQDEKTLYQWSADRLGVFPLPPQALNQHYKGCDSSSFIPLTALDDEQNVAGHLFIRYPDEHDRTTVRFGFVIVAPSLRQTGNGKKLLLCALDYAKTQLKAQRVTLGVFENNEKAYHCYASAGFEKTGTYTVPIKGQEWQCIEMSRAI